MMGLKLIRVNKGASARSLSMMDIFGNSREEHKTVGVNKIIR